MKNFIKFLSSISGVIVVGLAIEASKALQMFFSHHFFTLPLKKLKTEFPENQPDTSTASSDLFISDSLQYVRSRRYTNFLLHLQNIDFL